MINYIIVDKFDNNVNNIDKFDSLIGVNCELMHKTTGYPLFWMFQYENSASGFLALCDPDGFDL